MSRSNVGLGFQSGLVAGAAAGLVMLGARLAVGVPTIPELLLDYTSRLIPPAIFSFVLDNLLYAAKPLLVGCLAVGQLLLCGGIGALYEWRAGASPPSTGAGRRRLGLVLAAAIWVVLIAGLLPLVGAGAFGSALLIGPVAASATLLVSALVYGLCLALLSGWAAVAMPEGQRGGVIGRRALIRAVGLGSLGLVAGAFLVRSATAFATSSASALGLRAGPGGMPSAITSNEDFYKVSKDFVDPEIDAAKWTLEVTGLVEKPLKLSYAEFLALPAVERAVTLECVSNLVGGDLIGNAIWKGTLLKDLLEAARPMPGAVDVRLRAGDGYEDSITVERAMSPANIIAWAMNGEVLPVGHGFPARLLVPGIYGMKNVKWLYEIRLVDADFSGFWQHQDWSDTAYVKMMSRLDVPRRGATLPIGVLQVGGVAFSGERGISRVDVSFDGGATWQQAELLPALSPYTWVLWSADWNAPAGEHELQVRAYDSAGQVQDATVVGPFPDGGSGYHTIAVTVDPAKPSG